MQKKLLQLACILLLAVFLKTKIYAVESCSIQFNEYDDGTIQIDVPYQLPAGTSSNLVSAYPELNLTIYYEDGSPDYTPVLQNSSVYCSPTGAEEILCSYKLNTNLAIPDATSGDRMSASMVSAHGPTVCGPEYYLVTGEATVADPLDCGNGVCDAGESYESCPQDCADTSLDAINPLLIGGDTTIIPVGPGELKTPGAILSRFLLFAFPIAGFILFVMIVWGGFEILMTSSTKKTLDAGRQRIQAAVIGFILLFTSYWVIRIFEMVFGIKVI